MAYGDTLEELQEIKEKLKRSTDENARYVIEIGILRNVLSSNSSVAGATYKSTEYRIYKAFDGNSTKLNKFLSNIIIKLRQNND